MTANNWFYDIKIVDYPMPNKVVKRVHFAVVQDDEMNVAKMVKNGTTKSKVSETKYQDPVSDITLGKSLGDAKLEQAYRDGQANALRDIKERETRELKNRSNKINTVIDLNHILGSIGLIENDDSDDDLKDFQSLSDDDSDSEVAIKEDDRVSENDDAGDAERSDAEIVLFGRYLDGKNKKCTPVNATRKMTADELKTAFTDEIGKPVKLMYTDGEIVLGENDLDHWNIDNGSFIDLTF